MIKKVFAKIQLELWGKQFPSSLAITMGAAASLDDGKKAEFMEELRKRLDEGEQDVLVATHLKQRLEEMLSANSSSKDETLASSRAEDNKEEVNKEAIVTANADIPETPKKGKKKKKKKKGGGSPSPKSKSEPVQASPPNLPLKGKQEQKEEERPPSPNLSPILDNGQSSLTLSQVAASHIMNRTKELSATAKSELTRQATDTTHAEDDEDLASLLPPPRKSISIDVGLANAEDATSTAGDDDLTPPAKEKNCGSGGKSPVNASASGDGAARLKRKLSQNVQLVNFDVGKTKETWVLSDEGAIRLGK